MEGVDTHETMKNPDPIEALHATVERLTQETARAIGRQTSGLQLSLSAKRWSTADLNPPQKEVNYARRR
jgi:hypothetical protein